MLKLTKLYRMQDSLESDYEVHFQFEEESKDRYPEDWALMEQAWRQNDLKVEMQTDAGLVEGMLSRRKAAFDGALRFEVRGVLAGQAAGKIQG